MGLKLRRAETERREKNLCPNCGGTPVPGKIRCRECMDSINARKKARRAELKAENRCIDCTEPAEDGYSYCPKHRQVQSDNNKKYFDNKVAQHQCVKCTEPPKEGHVLCDFHLEAMIEGSVERVNKRKLSGVCTRCGEPVKEDRTQCEGCLEKERDRMQELRDNGVIEERRQAKIARGECTSCASPARQGSTTCDRCHDGTLYSKGRNNAELPAPTISIFEALDLKHDYIRSILGRVALPSLEAKYIDSECNAIQEGNEASNIYEWTCLTRVDGANRWDTLKTIKGVVPDARLRSWALTMEEWKAWSDDAMVVGYGTSRPEYHRMLSLEAYLPDDIEASSFTYYDPQVRLVNEIFSRNPDSELDPNKKIYLPDFNLENIAKRLNRCNGQEYTRWIWPALSEDSKQQGKSVYDVANMFNFIHSLHHVNKGNRFRPFNQGSTVASGSGTSGILVPRSPSKGAKRFATIEHYFGKR